MLILYGFPVSNYTNMVEFTLLERGIFYDYELTYPDQSAETLSKSKRGKVPFLKTEHGYISETSVILEYLEETYSSKPLLPSNPDERAYVRELMKYLELYIELPVRTTFLESIFDLTIDETIKAKAAEDLLFGVAAIKRHARFAPYLAGAKLTLADVVFLYSFDLAILVAKKLYQIDLSTEFPQAVELLQLLNANQHAKEIDQRRKAAFPAFVEAVRRKYTA